MSYGLDFCRKALHWVFPVVSIRFRHLFDEAAGVGIDAEGVVNGLLVRFHGETLQGFVVEHADAFAEVYSDEAAGYRGLPYRHVSVAHSSGQYVDGDAHTNGIESFWAMLKRGYKGVYHWWSRKHLN